MITKREGDSVVIIRLARTTVCLCDWVLVVGILFHYSDSNLLNHFTQKIRLLICLATYIVVSVGGDYQVYLCVCASKSLNQLLNRFVNFFF